MTMALLVYQYKQLNRERKEIRVLDVQPFTSDGMVQCSVRHVSLLDDPISNYEAVSYVWSLIKGDPVCIKLDGHTISVPPAAEDVLKNLRHPAKKRVLWVDAICINQEDMEERASQVALMGEVYSKTACTVIWLGAADDSTSMAFTSLGILYKQLVEETDNCRNLRKALYGSTNSFQYSPSDLPENVNFSAIQAMFRRPWFTRRWIVQESALAPKGVVYCGRNSMDMLQLFRSAVWIQHKQHKLPFDLDAEGGLLNASYMSAYVDHEEGWFSARHGQKVFLADLFRYFRTFNVTEPRDAVYALLGLSRWACQPSPMPSLITPDYSKPPRDVIRDAARMAINESGDLWLFRYVEHGRELPNPSPSVPPSWVPCLFRGPDPRMEPNHLRSAFRANLGIDGLDHGFAELLDSSISGFDSDILPTRGVLVDSVNEVGVTLEPEYFEHCGGLAKILDQVLVRRSLSEGRGSEALAKLPLLDLGLVVVGGSTFDPRPTTVQAGQSDVFEEFIESISKQVERLKHQDVETHLADFKMVLEDPSFRRCVWAIKYACSNRRLFTTKNGYVGLGPQAMRNGDCLVILSGSRMPVVLRQSGTKWNVLGPCYAHGVMYGETAKNFAELRDSILTFQLL